MFTHSFNFHQADPRLQSVICPLGLCDSRTGRLRSTPWRVEISKAPLLLFTAYSDTETLFLSIRRTCVATIRHGRGTPSGKTKVRLSKISLVNQSHSGWYPDRKKTVSQTRVPERNHRWSTKILQSLRGQ